MIPIKNRKDCPEQLRLWRIKVEKQSGYKLKAVRIDNASELVRHFQSLERELGIEVQTTVPHTSTQNGLAERENQQI
jgi:transposase InsO family protein